MIAMTKRAELDAALAEAGAPVLLALTAPWCEPCRKADEALRAATENRGGEIKLVRVNLDENSWLAERYQVDVIPTLLLFKGGRPVDRLTGIFSASEIDAALGEALKSA
jgi:thioredoxin-like negative regulator of GroEL